MAPAKTGRDKGLSPFTTQDRVTFVHSIVVRQPDTTTAIVTADAIRARSVGLGLDHIVARVDELCAHGSRYSYEDFDVLSYALSEIRLAETGRAW